MDFAILLVSPRCLRDSPVFMSAGAHLEHGGAGHQGDGLALRRRQVPAGGVMVMVMMMMMTTM
jgi:hypothetical protein